jgi:broad specificity phosphatase PhoE
VNLFTIRHGETAWSLSGQHTGTTDIPLTDNGRRLAERMRPVLARESFALVRCSPMQRARETCELAGLGRRAVIDADLVEWNYGEYEALTPKQIHESSPGWLIFRDGCPGGEAPELVAARVDRVIARARAAEGDVALFAHGHVLRVFAARWIGLPPAAGQRFLLDTGTLCILGFYRGTPAVKVWNGSFNGWCAMKSASRKWNTRGRSFINFLTVGACRHFGHKESPNEWRFADGDNACP